MVIVNFFCSVSGPKVSLFYLNGETLRACQKYDTRQIYVPKNIKIVRTTTM